MVVALTATQHIGRPEELASTLIRLESDALSFVSGSPCLLMMAF